MFGREELPSSDPPDEKGVRDAELDDGVQLLSPLLQEFIQLQEKTPSSEGQRRSQGEGEMLEQPLTYHFSLLHRAWEAIEEEAILAWRGVKVVLYQLHHHLVAHLQRAETGAHSGGTPQFYTQLSPELLYP